MITDLLTIFAILAAITAASLKFWAVLLGPQDRLTFEELVPIPIPRTVRIMSANLFLRPFGISDRICDGDYKHQRLQAFIDRHAVNTDIICIQGAYTTWSRHVVDLIAEARRVGFSHWTVPAAPGLFSRDFMDSGLVVLSRYPIRNVHRGRFWTHVCVDAGTPVHIINAHMQCDTRAFDVVAERARSMQLSELTTYITEKVPANVALAVCGDMNIHVHDNAGQTSTEYKGVEQVFRNFGMHDTVSNQYMGPTQWTVYERKPPHRIICTRSDLIFRGEIMMSHRSDYIWARNGDRYTFVNGRVLLLAAPGVAWGSCSDHQAVRVDLRIEPIAVITNERRRRSRRDD